MAEFDTVDEAYEPSSEERIEIDRKRPVAQQVYQSLRDRIISMELPPGINLSRQNLAARYGVSQTPIRDGVMKLEHEGLVEIYPQSRTLVARIDIASARETQFLRTAVELEVGRQLARSKRGEATVRAREALAHQRAILNKGGDDVRAFLQRDRELHRTLCDSAGRAGLWRMIIQRSGHLDRLRRLHLPTLGKMAETIAQHEAILGAIEAGDEARVAEAVRAHLSGTLSALDEIRRLHPRYF